MARVLREGAVQKWKEPGGWKGRHLQLLAEPPSLSYSARAGSRELGRIEGLAAASRASDGPYCFKVQDAQGEVSKFAAATKGECREWIAAISEQLAEATQCHSVAPTAVRAAPNHPSQRERNTGRD